MDEVDFHPDGEPILSSAPTRGFGRCDDCGCGAAADAPAGGPRLSRRLFTGLLGAAGGAAVVPAWARDGVEVGKQSWTTRLIPPEQIEAAGQQQYAQMMKQAQQQRALAPANDPQLRRLRFIAQRIIPLTNSWNARAQQWQWEVNLLGSKEINAFCMPGGKIAFYYGILKTLQLTDDEVAIVMGHEIAHALREHARERMGKTMATNGAIELGAAIFGLGNMGRSIAGIGGQLLSLRFSREDESEADLVGMELAARAGYNPEAGVSLWEKMGRAAKGAPPQMLSTHPAGPTRIQDIRANLPKVEGLYQRAAKPTERFSAPAA
ncbi:M48 family metallopeptidase [Roseateles amylovorans]|uniref:M48 family metallopeptidase n=1 Tax=Roseateles amylovorans TaxID=2978473 RepID=A0ABY6AZM6_9BURK|nr:M48 family metallopeptidase [Roseateles amylovorans]UXH78250.1 M48 family metallopeptidase [Roseateles amylovorans]